MSAAQVAGAQEKLSRYLSARKQEGILEQLDPRLLAPWVMSIQPRGKTSVGFPNLEDASSVLDHRVDLQAVPDDAGVSKETRAFAFPVSRHPVHVEPIERSAKVISLFENREPRKSRLVDLERETLEEGVVLPQRKAVFAIVVGTVERMVNGDGAIPGETLRSPHSFFSGFQQASTTSFFLVAAPRDEKIS